MQCGSGAIARQHGMSEKQVERVAAFARRIRFDRPRHPYSGYPAIRRDRWAAWARCDRQTCFYHLSPIRSAIKRPESSWHSIRSASFHAHADPERQNVPLRSDMASPERQPSRHWQKCPRRVFYGEGSCDLYDLGPIRRNMVTFQRTQQWWSLLGRRYLARNSGLLLECRYRVEGQYRKVGLVCL